MRVHHLIFVGMGLLTVAGCTQPQSSAEATAPPAVAAAQPSPAATPAKPPAAPGQDSLVVLFPVASASLSDTADGTIDHAARLFREGNPVVMTVTGFADPRGGELPNLILSAQRAATVKAALVAHGIPAQRLEMVAYGVTEPAVHDNPAAAENRRVVITWR